jgi:hypothetical protein
MSERQSRLDRYIRWLLALVTVAFLTTLWSYRAWGPAEAKDRYSISAYFYDDVMRYVFSPTLVVVGVLLIFYRGRSETERWLLNVAGVLLGLVAVLPMDRPPGGERLSWHAWVHYGSAVLFFVCLGAISVFRAKDTLRDRRDSTGKLAYIVTYNFTGWSMIGVPWLAIILNAKGASSAVYVVECVAVVVFLIYWLTKIAERDLVPLPEAAGGPNPDSSISSTIQQVLESEKSIETRLTGTAEAQKRTRLVLVFMGVPCAALFIASYNAYLSFDREFTLQQVAERPDDLDRRADGDHGGFVPVPARKFDKDRGNDMLTEQAIRTWSDSRSISSSLLGIKVSIDDAPVLGSTALFVISIWFLLSVRREYYTIYFLLKDTRQLDPARPDLDLLKVQWLVFHGIISSSVFSLYWKRFLPVWGGLAAVTGIEQRIKELKIEEKVKAISLGVEDRIEEIKATNGTERRIVEMEATRLNADRRIKRMTNEIDADSWTAQFQSAFLTLIVKFVFWLPVITLTFVILFDRLSYFERSPYRNGLMIPESANLSAFEILSLIVFGVFTFLLVITLTLASTYNEHAEQAVNSYYDNICWSLNALRRAPPPEPGNGHEVAVFQLPQKESPPAGC